VKLHNVCVVAAPLAPTWSAIVDLARIASALPGAALEPTETAGTFRGTMKIKFGPVVSQYSGTATLEEVDDDRHIAVVRIQGREIRGQGNASATIRNTLSPVAGATQHRYRSERQRHRGATRTRHDRGGLIIAARRVRCAPRARTRR
jgi:carbon monoxide dehydrogenase subunit G